MTDCRRKTFPVAVSPFGQPPTPLSTGHTNAANLLHLTECPFNIPLRSSSIVGNTFLFGAPSPGPKKKLSEGASLFSSDKRAKRDPLLESDKPNIVSTDTTNGTKLLSLELQNSPSPSMKLSDIGILNLDQGALGSPVARRPPKRQSNSQFHHPASSPARVTTPQRPASRSLSNQQRPLQNLLHQQVQSQHFEFSTPIPPNGKVSRRISVENFLRPPSRDSPFGAPAPMVDASIHLATQNNQPKRARPHPLSIAESALSSQSSESSATTQQQQQQQRPQNPRIQSLMDSQPTFSTPQNYKLIKPYQAAFMSEGLLSKRNRSNSAGPIPSSLHMPETPCKRPVSGSFGHFPTYEPSTPLTGTQRHVPLFLDSDSSSSQDTPAPSNDRSLSYLSAKSEYEFPPTPTKSVDNLGSTPGPLWRVHNLTKSPGGDSVRSTDSIHGNFPEISPAKEHRRRSTNGRLFHSPDLSGGRFGEKFEDSQIMGTGEFSEVYEAIERDTKARYAVKRTRFPMSGSKERQRRLEEVKALRILGPHEHILELIDSWEQYDHLFIQTELCENGSLDVFLRDYGNIERLDEFRVWKILIELTMGLQHIHDHNYIHLDIKPANVFITFEGTLKIGDFGLATPLPVPPGFEREGDREYIAPEIIELQQYDKPADIFSLGITILETAANVCLPDNGLPWQKLRSGDLSDAPRLSSSDVVEENGMDIEHRPKGLEGGKLDEIVRWMLSPNVADRPSCQQILEREEVVWVNRRRRAGGIIYEGEFGPDDDEVAVKEMEDYQMEM